MVLGVKKTEDLTRWTNRPKHVFGCTERKSTLIRVSCWTRWRNQKIMKKRSETQTLRTAYADGVRPPSLYQIWSG